MIKVHEELILAVKQQAEEKVLRDTCTTLISKGISTDTLYNEFEELRKTDGLSDEYEDTLLDIMDYLCGWCSPQSLLSQPAA